MSVQLSELLNLNVMSKFNIIAGAQGLDRIVNKVGILDYEMGEVIDSNFSYGEFVLTNLMIIKDDISQLEDIVRRLIACNTSGLAIKSVYFSALPESVKQIADENAYPIFIYETVYYEDVITAVSDFVRLSEEMVNKSKFIDELHHEGLLPVEVEKLALRINSSFRPWIRVVRFSLSSKEMHGFSTYQANKVLGENHICFIKNDEGYLFLSFDTPDVEVSVALGLCLTIGIKTSLFSSGMSSLQKLEAMNKACLESKYAYHYALMKHIDHCVPFSDLGLFQVIMPHSESWWMKSYYDRIILPLQEYDDRNGSELLKTAQAYVETGFDVKLTAEILFQHGNTVRYRMERIRKVLEDVAEKSQIDQELAFAIRVYELKQWGHIDVRS